LGGIKKETFRRRHIDAAKSVTLPIGGTTNYDKDINRKGRKKALAVIKYFLADSSVWLTKRKSLTYKIIFG